MTYAHCFNSDFYFDDNDSQPSERPTSLHQALVSMPQDRFREACVSCGLPEDATVDELLLYATETVNVVSNLESPVEVWIDPEGRFKVLVYEDL